MDGQQNIKKMLNIMLSPVVHVYRAQSRTKPFVTLAKYKLYLPDDGLCKPKHVGANIIVFFNVLTV